MSEYGEVEVPVNAAELSERQRNVLVGLDRISNLAFFQAKNTPGFYLPRVPADIATTLPQYLDAVADLAEKAKRDAERKAEEVKALSIKAAREAIEAPIEAWIRNGTVSMPGQFYGYTVPDELKEAIDAKHAEAKAILDDRVARLKAERSAKEKADQEAEAASAAAKAEQIELWINSKGTESQKARYKRGILDTTEIVDAMRDEAFAPLGDKPRYVKITRSELFESYGFYDEHEDTLSCSVEEAENVSDDEFKVLQEFERLIPDATVTVMGHFCALSGTSQDEDDLHAIGRRSIKVETVVGEFNFSREYAL